MIFILMFLRFWTFDENKWVKTQKGYELYTKIVGLKNYIKDYSRLSDSELQEIAIWEDYLVYAIILNNTSKLNKEAMSYYKKICDVREEEKPQPKIKKSIRISAILAIVIPVISIIAALKDILTPFVLSIISLFGFYLTTKGKEYNEIATKIGYITNTVAFLLAILIAISMWFYVYG